MKKLWQGLSAKSKQRLVLAGAILIVLGAITLVVYEPSKPELELATPQTQIKVLNTERLDDFTLASLSNTLDRQQEQLQAQQQQINQLLQQLKEQQRASLPPPSEPQTPNDLQLWQELWQELAELTPEEQCARYYEFIQTYPHLRNRDFERLIQFNYEQWQGGIKQENVFASQSFDPLKDFSLPEGDPYLETYDFESDYSLAPTYQSPSFTPEPQVPSLQIRSLETSELEASLINIPSGAVFTGTLVTGVDAPTTDGAKADPYPVLVRLDNLDFLPNSYQVDLESCFVLLSSYGDISSHRAFMRLQTLSCINQQGYILEGEIKGYAVGSDGKLGVAGRLVSKQGAVIAKSLAIGFLQGVSEAFASPNVIIPNYGTNPSLGDAGLGGSLQGTSRALDRIANFYLSLANKMFPLIEVQAGTKVDLIVTAPIALGVSERKIQAEPLGQSQSQPQKLNPQTWQSIE
ncbi:TraB/VirB10 family protein [Psittacicella gerlachiana]|uniref:Conjugal transfer pilus assembly protein TraB n=1 Tax=Psittacicella gerlachiana TaxID=2028574 RepID=A0A3A1YC75_9GAMM|nr:TraB/VirB10 family protein [Psittacicella gerlachiana]RIY35863.1 hypothetical protein CKF59_03120 [Psittacicella gerlachiana]